MRGFIGLNTTVAIRKQNQVLWISNKVWQQNMWLLIEFIISGILGIISTLILFPNTNWDT